MPKISLTNLSVSVFSLIGNFDTNQDGKVSFGEFVQSLWYMQQQDDRQDSMMVSHSLRRDPTFSHLASYNKAVS